MQAFRFYLIRHGLAGQFGDYEDDAVRPLTDEGRVKTRKVAQRLKVMNLDFDRILTSPYARAQQTAEILQAVELGKTIETVDFLRPDGSFAQLHDWLMQTDRKQTLAIVGHEPNLSAAAEQLIFGQNLPGPHSQRLVLKKAGVIALNAPMEGDLRGQCELLWLVSPKVLLG
jgi:phosphohistidine phosphatase